MLFKFFFLIFKNSKYLTFYEGQEILWNLRVNLSEFFGIKSLRLYWEIQFYLFQAGEELLLSEWDYETLSMLFQLDKSRKTRILLINFWTYFQSSEFISLILLELNNLEKAVVLFNQSH